MILPELIFWLSLVILLYIYFGYPFLVFLLSKLLNKKVNKKSYKPTVTILIAAFNEENHIRETIENKLHLDYPKDKLDIIVVSDGSIDKTDEIVEQFYLDNVRLIRQDPRKGKTSALNMAVPMAKGEIIIFSDANSIYSHDALTHLLDNFNDQKVGYVTGKMIYTNSDGLFVTGKGCSAYMKYENLLREHETKLGSIVGVDGGIDAVRKFLYKPMRPDQLPDFILPLRVIEQGYRVIYEPLAFLKESVLESSYDEYKMRVRVSLRSLWAISDMKHLLNVKKYNLFSFQLFSHKLLRYLCFIFTVGFYTSNLFLFHENLLFTITFTLQNLFYLSTLIAYALDKQGKELKSLYIPYFFLLINLAATHAFLKYLCGEKQVIWTPRKG